MFVPRAFPPATRPLPRRARAWLAALPLLAGGMALAHATIVIGSLASEPAAPPPGRPFTLRVELIDPFGVPTEDAVLLAEFLEKDAESEVTAAPLRLTETTTPGRYEATAVLPAVGAYALRLRDRTFRQEEAQALVELDYGSGPLFTAANRGFLFPPTATGPQGLGTWLVWLLGVPLLVGAAVTLLVLRGGRKREDPTAGTDGPPDTQPAPEVAPRTEKNR